MLLSDIKAGFSNVESPERDAEVAVPLLANPA